VSVDAITQWNSEYLLLALNNFLIFHLIFHICNFLTLLNLFNRLIYTIVLLIKLKFIALINNFLAHLALNLLFAILLLSKWLFIYSYTLWILKALVYKFTIWYFLPLTLIIIAFFSSQRFEQIVILIENVWFWRFWVSLVFIKTKLLRIIEIFRLRF